MSPLAKIANTHAHYLGMSALFSTDSFKCPAMWDSSLNFFFGGGGVIEKPIRSREEKLNIQPIQPHPFFVTTEQLSWLWLRFPLTDCRYRSWLGHSSFRCMWFCSEKSIDFIYAATNCDISTHCLVIYKVNLVSELLNGCCPVTRWLRF